MLDHPFVILLKSLMNLKLYNFKYDDIMIVLKSNLILPDFIKEFSISSPHQEKRQQINYFENIVLANGYFGYRFNSMDFTWHFDNEDSTYQSVLDEIPEQTFSELANNWRTWLHSKTDQAFKAWNKPMTGKQASTWLYRLIDDLGIKEEFILSRDHAIESGNIEKSRRDEQVWQVFVNLLEEFHTIYQDKIIDFNFFTELMIVGLTNSTYHIIPTTLDQVTFTSIESPQVGPYKVAFVIGMDEKSLPSIHQESSLLDQGTRESLRNSLLAHQYLMQLNEQQYSQELLLTYQLLLRATDAMYISFSTSVNNVSVRMSPYIHQLVSLLKLPVYNFTHNLTDDLLTLHASTFGSYVMEQNLVLQLIHQIHKTDLPLNNTQKQVLLAMRDYNHSVTHPYQSLSFLIEAVTDFGQLPKQISPAIALKLFGKDMNVSVSKIEQYYQDPFSHFLIHGLKLQERKLFELDYARSGDYFHDFLDQFTRQLINNNLSIKDMSDEDIVNYFNKVNQEITQDNRFNIMTSHAKFNAIKRQMDVRLMNFIKFTQAQLQRTRMATKQSEAIFGINPSRDMLNGFVYPLKSGGKLNISGKIDRIDIAQTNKASFLQIIDYKSGKKDFDIIDTYYGLDLQVLTYLSVALNNYPNSLAFGAFYQPLLHSYLDIADKQLIQKSHLNNLDVMSQDQLENNRLKGFVSLPEEDLLIVDGSIEETNKSLIYPVTLKKDGNYMASSKVFTQNELDTLLNYVHLKFKQAADEIQSGNIELNPFKENQFTTSLQTNYRVISGFDATENYQAYRAKSINKKKVIEQMKLDLEEGSDLDNEEDI
ncbi:PD-(D/E)XK nuclease family protein [Aerococcaceae bacterium WGS1372]